MHAPINIRKVSIVTVTIFALVAVLLPLCAMLECGMSPVEMGSHHIGLGFSSTCVTTTTSVAQAAIAPGNLQTLIMTLVVALGLAFALALPDQSTGLVRVLAEEPPPPPEDPRGARFIV